MPAPNWEDLDQFLDADDFAQTAIIRRDGNLVIEVLGIFDDPYFSPEIGEYTFEDRQPRLTVKEVSVILVRRGDTVDVDGKTFDLINDPEPDGTGMSVLTLASQPGVYNAPA